MGVEGLLATAWRVSGCVTRCPHPHAPTLFPPPLAQAHGERRRHADGEQCVKGLQTLANSANSTAHCRPCYAVRAATLTRQFLCAPRPHPPPSPRRATPRVTTAHPHTHSRRLPHTAPPPHLFCTPPHHPRFSAQQTWSALTCANARRPHTLNPAPELAGGATALALLPAAPAAPACCRRPLLRHRCAVCGGARRALSRPPAPAGCTPPPAARWPTPS